MTISKKKTPPATNQMRLFDLLVEQTRKPTPAFDASVSREFRECMAEDIRNAVTEQGKALTRFDIAAAMSNILEKEVTKSMIDNWTAPSHASHNIDLDELVAFSMATRGSRAVSARFRPAGLFVFAGPDALRAAYQRLDEKEKEIKQEKKMHKLLIRQLEKGVPV